MSTHQINLTPRQAHYFKQIEDGINKLLANRKVYLELILDCFPEGKEDITVDAITDTQIIFHIRKPPAPAEQAGAGSSGPQPTKKKNP